MENKQFHLFPIHLFPLSKKTWEQVGTGQVALFPTCTCSRGLGNTWELVGTGGNR